MGRRRKATTWQDPLLTAKLYSMDIMGPCVVVEVGEQMLVAKSLDEVKIKNRDKNGEFTWASLTNSTPLCKFCSDSTYVVSAGHPGRKIDGRTVEVHLFYCKKCDKHFYIIPANTESKGAPDF